MEVPEGYKDPAPFQFQNNDTVVILGNALGERLQYDGHLETSLQLSLKDQQVNFRNLGLSGDTIKNMPRVTQFPELHGMLQHIDPTVFFCFFGYNESFEEAPEKFQAEYVDFVGRLRAIAGREKDSFPRIVLFSPIAQEAYHGDFNRSRVDANNQRLVQYTAAVKATAEEAGVTFVDLYTPSAEWFKAHPGELTINGLHLNATGNKMLAGHIAKVLGTKAVVHAGYEMIRSKVLEKNTYWHKRYRAVNGNDIWGVRSRHRFMHDQANAQVMQHEMTILDAYAARADKPIWAALNGKNTAPDFSDAPKHLEVISNVGVAGMGYTGRGQGGASYLSAKDSHQTLKVPEGFQVGLFADESRFPELVNPVQMQVDARGRLWVACWGNYPSWAPGDERLDSVLILEDTDEDGIADKKTVFASIDNPLGFEFWNGGVLVTSQPNLLFLKDTDGDDVADQKEVLLTGMGCADSHHAANNLVMGPDGGIYFQSGAFLVNHFETPWNKAFRAGTAMFRFDPRFYTLTMIAPAKANPHGTSFCRWGNMISGDATGGTQYHTRIYENGFATYPFKYAPHTRPSPANAILSSANLPDAYQQNLVVCNVIGFLGLRRYNINMEGGSIPFESTRKDFQPGEAFGEHLGDLIEGTDKNFRPSDAVVGAEGAVYIADWHNIVIGHRQHNVREPKRDRAHGRIYRMVYTRKPLQEPVKIHNASLTQLFENLRHPVDGVRHRSRVEMSRHSTEDVIAHLESWMPQLDKTDTDYNHHLLEALWTYQRRNVRNLELLNTLLAASDVKVQNAAKVVEHFWTKFDPHNPSHNPVQKYVVAERYPRQAPKHLAGDDLKSFLSGSTIFSRTSHCATCHGEHGRGNQIYPPLAKPRNAGADWKNEWISGPKERLIRIIMHGMQGTLEIEGNVYDLSKGTPPMPGFRDMLSDQDIADVATFVRNYFGNKAGVVRADEVKAVREQYQGRTAPWTVEELQTELTSP